MKSMKEIAVSTIVGLVVALVVGTLLISIVGGNSVKEAIESGITENINNAAHLGQESESDSE